MSFFLEKDSIMIILRIIFVLLVLLQAYNNLPNIIKFYRNKCEELKYDRMVLNKNPLCTVNKNDPLFKAYVRAGIIGENDFDDSINE